MTGQSRGNALDHVVVVLFENRSLDSLRPAYPVWLTTNPWKSWWRSR